MIVSSFYFLSRSPWFHASVVSVYVRLLSPSSPLSLHLTMIFFISCIFCFFIQYIHYIQLINMSSSITDFFHFLSFFTSSFSNVSLSTTNTYCITLSPGSSSILFPPTLQPSFRFPTRAAWTPTRFRWKESEVTLWSSGTPPLSRPHQPSSPYSSTSHGLPSPETRMVSEWMTGGSMYGRRKCVCGGKERESVCGSKVQ